MTISDLRTFATFDGHGGKVSKRVEVLDHEPPTAGPYAGLVAVRGEHPLGALDERPVDDGADLARGVPSIGWVDPGTLRDWYRPDRVVVSRLEARRSGLEPGLYADSRGRGRVRIDGLEALLAPDGRPAFRALAGPADAPVVDVPLPTDQAVRLVAVRAVEDGLEVVTTPVSPFLSPAATPRTTRTSSDSRRCRRPATWTSRPQCCSTGPCTRWSGSTSVPPRSGCAGTVPRCRSRRAASGRTWCATPRPRSDRPSLAAGDVLAACRAHGRAYLRRHE